MSLRRRNEGGADGEETAELAALADGSLEPARQAVLEARLAASPALAERLAEQQQAVAFARKAADEVEAPPALRAAVEAQRRERARQAPRRLVLATTGAIAVAAAAIVVGVLAFRGTSTEHFRASLAPTGLVPGASGEATLTKTTSGWRVELDASGLPRLDNGRFYEAWLRNSAGVLVPIGTFNEGRRVTLWAGVKPTEFGTLTVTRERADGDQRSSGQKVLVGRVGTGR